MKEYKCSYCSLSGWTTRREARKCILIHIRSDKGKREKKREGSIVTEKMLRRIHE